MRMSGSYGTRREAGHRLPVFAACQRGRILGTWPETPDDTSDGPGRRCDYHLYAALFHDDGLGTAGSDQSDRDRGRQGWCGLQPWLQTASPCVASSLAS